LRFPLNVIKVNSTGVSHNFSVIVKKYTAATVAQNVAQTVFTGIIHPLADPNIIFVRSGQLWFQLLTALQRILGACLTIIRGDLFV